MLVSSQGWEPLPHIEHQGYVAPQPADAQRRPCIQAAYSKAQSPDTTVGHVAIIVVAVRARQGLFPFPSLSPKATTSFRPLRLCIRAHYGDQRRVSYLRQSSFRT